MISQLLFGELVEIMDTKGRQWSWVRNHSDNLVGWVESSQLKPITPSEFDNYQQHFSYSLELMQPVMGDTFFIPITLGARLPDFDGIRFHLGESFFTFSGQTLSPGNVRADSSFILKLARRYLNTPFLWGGRSPFGMDSGGLVQMVFSIAGHKLPREAIQQVEVGKTIDFMEQAQPGDIAFFENRAGRITHTGLLMPNGRIIHAFGRVRIDLVDHFGIFQEETGRYTHKLRLIRRVLPKESQSILPANEGLSARSRQVELFEKEKL